MGSRGPKPKPKTDRKLAYEKGIPTCPSFLSPIAKREFKRVATILHKAQAIQKVDLSNLMAYAVAFGEYQQLSKDIAKQGPTVDSVRQGEIVNPRIRARQIAFSQMIRASAKLGLSPVDRTRLSTPTLPEPDDPIDRFMNDV